MANYKIDNRKDILLLILYSPGRKEEINEPVIGRTRLTKMLFLFRKEALDHFKKGTEINEDNFYEFFPWNFGPFSKDAYDDITFFILRDYIREGEETEEEALPESADEWSSWLNMSPFSNEDSFSEYDEKEYTLTEKGISFTSEIYDSLTSEQKKILSEFKSRINEVPLRALLKYVYSNYEEFTKKSKIKDYVLS